MTRKLADYIEAGMALDADERLEAAHQLLLSVDRDAEADQDEVDAAWSAEIDRRVDEIVSGKAQLHDVDESHAQLRAELAAMRRK